MLLFQILIAAFALVFGHPKRLTHGYDDFGNICGSQNEKIDSLEHSGLDMRQKPYLFYLDIKNIKNSLKLCVSKCPDRNLNSISDLREFYLQTNTSLCQYDFKFDDAFKEKPELFSSAMGPCPVFPIYKRL